MPYFRTLYGRFGTLYAFILFVVTAVCAVVWWQLSFIRADSARVMEETRELEVLVRVRSNLTAAQGCLTDPECTGADERKRVSAFVSPALAELEGFDDPEGDPSLLEHQEAEERLLSDLVKRLRSLETILMEEEEIDGQSFAAILSSAAHGLDVIHRETLDEAREADLDLEKRADRMRFVMLITALIAFMLLGVAMLAVHLTVVRPLRVLRAGAERYGRGELGHRIRVRNRDEIADLTEALNGMAGRLADAQEHLEDRVRTRTREFIRAARLADLGVLASGVAHEVNTPLGSILSCAEGLQRRLRKNELPPDLLEDYSETIIREVQRARSITTRMLALVRKEGSQLADVSLQVVVDQGRSALGYKADHRDVKLRVRDLEQDTQVHVDAGELVQILVNLLSNAIDASPPGAEVYLRVVLLAGWFQFVVEDNGPGIAEENMERILEPFFTTKDPDEGTGLGLALVNNLVESHMGQISVENRKEGGARFTVKLPMDWRLNA